MTAHGRLLRLVLASDDRYRLWVPLNQMSPQLVDAVLLHEDNWYWWHPGFNPYGLLRGAWVTYVRHGSRQGGSTITMQLARLLWPLNTRSPLGKAGQVARAIQLELFYSKHDILEAYLNYAPYGHNVEGAGAAAIAYFDRPVGALSLPEALTLAVLPQDPGAPPCGQGPGDAGLINSRLRTSRDRLYHHWLTTHPEDAAPQTAFRPAADHSAAGAPALRGAACGGTADGGPRAAGGGEPRVTTTIDLGLQHILERQITRYIARSNSKGIANASAILVDTRDMSVRALVGSADYFDRGLSGQVNGTLARRSPGSTLKPFIYALGFDQGILHPRDGAARCAHLVRALYAGEFRRPVPGPHHRHRRPEPQPQHSRGLDRLAASCALTSISSCKAPASARWRARNITAWRWCWAAAKSACRRWRSFTPCWPTRAC